MRTIERTLLSAPLLLWALLAGAGARAEVNVSYVQPEQFSDVPFSPLDRERVLKQLSEHFAKLGKQLPAGQTLKLEVLDVDLAGRMYPRRGGDEIRVMNGGADWPRLHLRYTLEANGQVLRSGDEQLSNMMYQDRINRYGNDDPLRYEKQMLDEWFGKNFPPAEHG
ncbi:DUF3016 domain-containing protein [Rugamonas sp. CCM 8940]|uniref:DUF3016 domain-containing protein n=1 Tax=Rugamonas sp. CCM 8940 TaxID=2765359 RepID=UPI0018F398AF|nr:DUF3016 domain-containing protein [Rugamonas sp. CCM 8940]MBJ7312717.1 DUF3016 domain-containing protein [Rugamonas sp. CCM 8940]